MIVLRTTKTFYSHFIHSFYAAIKAYDIKSSATQEQQHNSNTTATQQQHNGNKKKPKYVKLTMSSKRFNMLALHVLPACLLHLLHTPPPLLPSSPIASASPCPSCACDYKANLFKAFNKHAQPHTKWRLTHFYTSTYQYTRTHTHTQHICMVVCCTGRNPKNFELKCVYLGS